MKKGYKQIRAGRLKYIYIYRERERERERVITVKKTTYLDEKYM